MAEEFHSGFKRVGRAHLPDILATGDAKDLHEAMKTNAVWNMVFFANGRHFDLSADGWYGLEQAKKDQTLDIVHNEARRGFCYMYDNLPLYDIYHGGGDLPAPLRTAFEFLNSDAFLGFMRGVTGFDDIAFADAQATRYSAGHFLTTHDDAVAGKNRRAAYVLNLTHDWQDDWGGYLNFFSDDGHVTGAYKPMFNALNVFAVPARHSVGVVAPFAGTSRYSITGWLRAGKDPKGA